uniref:SHSP domain-containing protein n=1 Tax=Strigamia maritima TaxID=126957 RepID=T1JNU0_STRMM
MALRFASVILRNGSKTLRFKTPTRNFGWRARCWDDSLPAVIRQMNRSMQQMERDYLMSPSFSVLDVFKRLELPVNYEISQVDGARKMRWQLDLSNYKPEEIKVTVKEKNLMIHAKKEESDGKGGKSIQEYSKQVLLPDDANMNTIKSSFSNGVLKVDVDLPGSKTQEEIEIPK